MSLKHGWSKDAEQSGDFTPYVAIQTEHGRIGLVTCKRCGAAVILDEEKATIAHLRWHLEPEGAAVPAAPPTADDVLACRCLRHATIPPTIMPPATQECGLCMREEGILVGRLERRAGWISGDLRCGGRLPDWCDVHQHRRGQCEAYLAAAPLAGEAQEPKRCNDLCPPSYQGHWRDWHKGHGCDVEARTLIGKPEPAPEPTLTISAEARRALCQGCSKGLDPEEDPDEGWIHREGVGIVEMYHCTAMEPDDYELGIAERVTALLAHKAPSAAKETR